MAAVVTEMLAHRATGIRRNELQRRRFGCGRRDDDGVVHRAGLAEPIDDLRDGRALLSDSDINADDVAALLIDDRVDSDSGLAGLAVADDQLALAAPDGNHAVDRLQTGLKRFFHRLARDDAR